MLLAGLAKRTHGPLSLGSFGHGWQVSTPSFI